MNVGIDLGTTNSALAYIDPVEAENADFPPIHILEIPQHVRQDAVEPQRTLPSFLYLGDDQTYTGVYAREQGALVPTRPCTRRSRGSRTRTWIAPRKSCPGMRRRLGVFCRRSRFPRSISSTSARPGRARKGEPLSAQHVVLTVPASFDEEARELTVQAAKEAGIENLTLIEEPAAAFYSWIANHLTQSQKSLFDGQVVLVCDVGGGTSDFTLIRVQREGDRVEFTRTAVGKHLLLGGDNLDLTLTWLVEIETRNNAFPPTAQRSAPPMRGRQRAAAVRSEAAKSRHHRPRRRHGADRRHAAN